MQHSTHIILLVSLTFFVQCYKVGKRQVPIKLYTEPVVQRQQKYVVSRHTIPCETVNTDSQSSNEIYQEHCLSEIESTQIDATSQESKESEKSENLPIEIVDNHLTADEYGWMKNKFSAVVNPFRDFQFYTNTNSFKSVWLKCAACLAIANQINSTFYEFYNANYDLTPNEFNVVFKTILEETCQNGFKNLDLREYEGNVVIARASIYSSHVPSKMDGEWTKVLSEICLRYINNINYNRLFNQHLTGYLKFDDFLCRSEGLYRDCNNLGLEYLQVPQYEGTLTLCFCIKHN